MRNFVIIAKQTNQRDQVNVLLLYHCLLCHRLCHRSIHSFKTFDWL